MPRVGRVTISIIGLILTLGNALNADETGRKPLRAGMIGLDTSHVIRFTKLFNDPNATGELASVEIVAGYPGGTDFPPSRTRVDKFTEELRGMGIEIVDSIPTLLEKVDVVLLESVDGRPHLEQVLPVFKAGKRVFIDKPVAGSLKDAIAIFDASKSYKVPVFSTSSLRYSEATQRISKGAVGKVIGCDTYGPCEIHTSHPDLFWYGIHGVEPLFTIMGPGCETVTRISTGGTDMVIGRWKDGRIGSYRGAREGKYRAAGGTVFGTEAVMAFDRSNDYHPLLVEIAKFFHTGVSPVSAEETIEIFAFMEAADESKRQGGAPVSLESVIAKARNANRTE